MAPLFTLIHVSDLHFGHPAPISAEVQDWWCQYPALSGYFGHCGRALRYLEEKVATIREQEPSLALLATGDLTAYASDEQFTLAVEYLRDRASFPEGRSLGLRLGQDAMVIPGNHDHWSGREAKNVFDLVMYGGPTAMFRRTFPKMPVVQVEQWLSERRKLVMVGIDTDADLKPSTPSKFWARGDFVNQLDQAEDLFGADPTGEIRVLAMHHSRMLPQYVCGMHQKSREALDVFIRRNRISVLLSGHVHVCRTEHETMRNEDGKWVLVESRCGTTSQRSLSPLGCAQLKLQPNSFLVHRIDKDSEGFLIWSIEEFVRGPRTPFDNAGKKLLRYRFGQA
jgi:3',5'-cyclic AMP phosphodiesterase CpdA